MDNNKRIVEINGIKLEVDLTTAKVINNYRVGDKIKVLIREYGESYSVYPGVIVDFTDFKNLPTITVAYLKSSYKSAEIIFTHINSSTVDKEIAPCETSWIPFSKNTVLEAIDGEILSAEQTVKDMRMKKEFFLNNFGKFFNEHFAIIEQEGD